MQTWRFIGKTMGLALLFGTTIFMFAWWQAGSMAAAR